ncbi:TIGR00730 family Rossman fold protein [Allokutzneria sp. A3M-2-11 16]|uniref:LOG family protein n=1 Tax=Allokutzneria sp. A3M-2-11 16 TaxID=2962043 RepID=UPI0020B6D2CD|nr:TIGR00730 family Rossman fold protein [Allokutzneria sp. A3M-2-11 16]MCP3802403.1 TIGR00730 family Rossman fold protein [Allokutzneria sp. A3M-2-11 16]
MRVCVFCGSRPGRGTQYVETARNFGRLLGERGIGLVYGGASVGTMGEIADAALASGGEVHGVIPHQLQSREIGHSGLTELHVVDSMHTRKAKMAELADAFVALPGGIGTLEELFEVWTWSMIGIHAKPLGLLDVKGFFRPLVSFADHLVAEEFLREQARELLIVDDDPVRLLDRLGVLA